MAATATPVQQIPDLHPQGRPRGTTLGKRSGIRFHPQGKGCWSSPFPTSISFPASLRAPGPKPIGTARTASDAGRRYLRLDRMADRQPAEQAPGAGDPGQAQCIVPTIIQLELAKWLTREAGEEQADQMIAYTQKCIVVPLDTTIALKAADLHRQFKLATADAIVYATALERGADLLTCDAHFETLPEVAYFPETCVRDPQGTHRGFPRMRPRPPRSELPSVFSRNRLAMRSMYCSRATSQAMGSERFPTHSIQMTRTALIPISPRPAAFIAFLLLAGCAAGPQVADLAQGQSGWVVYPSSAEKISLRGDLQFRPGAPENYPAIVIAHASGGLGEQSERWARFFRERGGIATFKIDYFGPRGIRADSAVQPVPTNDTIDALHLWRATRVSMRSELPSSAFPREHTWRSIRPAPVIPAAICATPPMSGSIRPAV